jgi:hypothetical protein
MQHGVVNEDARQRIEADLKAAEAAGFAPRQALFAEGTKVRPDGKARFSASRQDFDEKPDVGQALERLRNRIQAEERTDHQVPIKATGITDSGELTIQGNQTGLFFEEQGFAGYASRLPADYAASFLKSVPPGLRSKTVNRLVELLDEDSLARFRIRKNPEFGGHGIFSVVSPKYTPFDIDILTDVIERNAPEHAKCDVLYDGRTISISMLFHAPEKLKNLGAGDFFKGSIVVKTRDDGTGGLNIDAALWRNLCLNLIIVDRSVVNCGNAKHTGSIDSMSNTLEAGIAKGMDALGHFADAWTSAEAMEIIGDCTAADAIARLVARGIISVPGVKKKELARNILSAYWDEPGQGMTSVVNAVTRAAHEKSWSSTWATDTLQRQAGVLLFGSTASKVKPMYLLDVAGSEKTEKSAWNILDAMGETGGSSLTDPYAKSRVQVPAAITTSAAPRPNGRTNLEF